MGPRGKGQAKGQVVQQDGCCSRKKQALGSSSDLCCQWYTNCCTALHPKPLKCKVQWFSFTRVLLLPTPPPRTYTQVGAQLPNQCTCFTHPYYKGNETANCPQVPKTPLTCPENDDLGAQNETESCPLTVQEKSRKLTTHNFSFAEKSPLNTQKVALIQCF